MGYPVCGIQGASRPHSLVWRKEGPYPVQAWGQRFTPRGSGIEGRSPSPRRHGLGSEPHASRIRGLALGLSGNHARPGQHPEPSHGLAERGGKLTLGLSSRGGPVAFLTGPPGPPCTPPGPGGPKR